MAQKRLPKDFNHMKPDDIEITDPIGAELQAQGKGLDREYPKHVYRDLGVEHPYVFAVVIDAADERLQRAQGWKSAQELDADRKAGVEEALAAGPVVTRKPRSPLPKSADAAQ